LNERLAGCTANDRRRRIQHVAPFRFVRGEAAMPGPPEDSKCFWPLPLTAQFVVGARDQRWDGRRPNSSRGQRRPASVPLGWRIRIQESRIERTICAQGKSAYMPKPVISGKPRLKLSVAGQLLKSSWTYACCLPHAVCPAPNRPGRSSEKENVAAGEDHQTGAVPFSLRASRTQQENLPRSGRPRPPKL